MIRMLGSLFSLCSSSFFVSFSPRIAHRPPRSAPPSPTTSSRAPRHQLQRGTHTLSTGARTPYSPPDKHIKPSKCDECRGEGDGTSSRSASSDSKSATTGSDVEPLLSDKYLVQSITIVNCVLRDDQWSSEKKSELESDLEGCCALSENSTPSLAKRPTAPTILPCWTTGLVLCSSLA